MQYIIKYAGEISTKQSRTKWGMINMLYSNIVKAVKFHGLSISEGKVYWDFLYLDIKEDAVYILKNIPGIQYFAEVTVLDSYDKNTIIEQGFNLFKNKIKGKKFAVRCRNKLTKNKTFRSKDLEIELGDKLFVYSSGVDLKHADVFCHVEIRDKGTFLYSEKIQGLTGFPVGNTGKGIMMFSGGIDSPVAAYKAIRIGIKPVFVYFDLGGNEQKKNTYDIFRFIYNKYLAGLEIKFIEIPFLETIEYIRTLPHKYQNLLLKYFFYNISDKLAYRYKANAVITGEALGQVSTQTIQNLTLLDKYVYHSVFRPTLFLSKLEIIDIAEEIGTFDMSYKGKEFCAIATKNVVTGGRKDIFDNIIKDIPLQQILHSLVKDIKIMGIDDFDESNNDNNEVSSIDNADRILVNLGSKLSKTKQEIAIDLDKALLEFEKWDKTKLYKIVCDEGVKSKILSKHMKEKGFDVVTV